MSKESNEREEGSVYSGLEFEGAAHRGQDGIVASAWGICHSASLVRKPRVTLAHFLVSL